MRIARRGRGREIDADTARFLGLDAPGEPPLAFGGMLGEMDLVTAQEAARYVVRCFRWPWRSLALDGGVVDPVPPIPWIGPAIAKNWFELDEHDAQKVLQQMFFEASTDWDAWKALNLIAARHHDEGRTFPRELADWCSRLHQGEIREPPKPPSNEGQPSYALDRRNRWFHRVFFILHGFLGLGKMECYKAIADECGVGWPTVYKGIKAARSLRGGN